MTHPVDRTTTTPNTAPVRTSDTGGTRTDSPAFRALLDSIEQLAAKDQPAPAVDDTESLQRAMRDADDGFREAMDLRRKLEEAFRQRLS